MPKIVLPLALVLACTSAALGSPRIDRAWNDCASDNTAASIRGCGEVIARGARETAEARGGAHLNRGIEHFKAGRYQEALSDYRAAVTFRPTWARPHMEMVFVFKKLGQPELAFKSVNDAIGLESEIRGGYYNRADLLDDRGDLDGALADVTRAIQLDPTSEAAHNLRGVLYNKKKDFARALIDFNIGLRQGASNPLLYGNRAFSYLQMGYPALAVADYDIAIELAPDRVPAINGRGIAYSRIGQTDLALADFERALRINPSYRFARENRVDMLLVKKDCRTAMPELDRLISENATPRLLAMRGNCMGALGNIAGAVIDFDAALSREPDLALALNGRRKAEAMLSGGAPSSSTF